MARIAVRVGVAVRESLADFEELYERTNLHALRLAALLTGNAQVAEDVVAEVFARVYVAWRRGRITDPDAYVRRAVINEVTSRSRRRVLERREEQRERSLDQPQPSDTDRLLERKALVAALQQLPARHRIPVVLRYFEDLSEAHTAQAMGVPIGTVKSSVARGLRELRAIVGEEWT